MKVALPLLEGELATALSIYTMNLYDLLEKSAWEGVKGYHFQFNRKRVRTSYRTTMQKLELSGVPNHPLPLPARLHFLQ